MNNVKNKYVGVLNFLNQVKNNLEIKQRKLEELSMDEVRKMWDVMGANGETLQMDLSWVSDKNDIDNIQNKLEDHNIVVASMIEDIGIIKNEISGVRSDLSQTNDIINKMLKIMKQQYNIYEPMEVSPEGALSNWDYVLDPTTQSVTLNKYKSTATDQIVVVYANYIQNNVKYATKLASNFNFNANTNVKTISFSNNLDLSGITSIRYFSGCTNLEKVSFNNAFKNCNITDISGLFSRNKISSIDFENLNISSLTNINNLFLENKTSDSNFVNSILKKINISNITSMKSIFNGCTNLASLDLSSWDTSNVTNMGSMFTKCSSLTSLDLTSFDINKLENDSITGSGAYQMFLGCTNLTEILVSRGKWNDDIVNETSNKAFFNCGVDHVTYVD